MASSDIPPRMAKLVYLALGLASTALGLVAYCLKVHFSLGAP